MPNNQFAAIFKFRLREPVALSTSHEKGIVIGRADYDFAEPTYLVRYTAADGRCVEVWWTESAVQAAGEEHE